MTDKASKTMRRPKYSAVGLFSGCGGLDLGARRAGFDVVAAFDNDEVAVETYRKNVGRAARVADLGRGVPRGLPRDLDLLLGGPPCQGFSSAGKKVRDDPRNLLWSAYIHALSAVRPKVFVLENVYGFSREYENFERAVRQECGDEYVIGSRKFNMQFYGVPQHRLRLVVTGVRRDVADAMVWPQPEVEEFWGYTKHAPGIPTLQDAVEHLGPATASERPRERSWGCPHEYLALEASHLRVARHVPNGGSLRSIPDRHMPPPFLGRVRPRVGGWPWYYRKPRPQLPARTVTASTRPIYSEVLAPDVIPRRRACAWVWEPVDPLEHTRRDGLYVSPVDQRRLTIRESSLLQTFPEDFEFFGDLFEKQRQIGNAVPVAFAERLCAAVADLLKRGRRRSAVRMLRGEGQLRLGLG